MIKKLFSVYSSNLFLGILGIITVPILLNNVGIEGYGYYGIYLTLFSYFTLFELGIIKHFTKLISQKNEEVNEVISCFYIFTISVILVCTPITVFATNILFGLSWKVAMLIGIIVSIEYILYLPAKIYSSYAVANKNFERISLYNFLSGLFRYFIIIFIAILTQNVFLIIILLVIRRLFDINLSRKIIKETIKVFDTKKVNKENLFKVFGYYKESMYLSGTQALQINLNGMISLIISKLFGVEGLGVYRSIYDLLSKVWFFSNGLGLVVFPYFAGKSVGTNKYKKYVAASWVFYTLVYVTLILLFPIVNRFLLNGSLISNDQIKLFVFVLISVLLIAQGNLSFEFLQANGRYKSLMKISFVTNFVFLIITLILYRYIPDTFSVIISWTLCSVIQTLSFEYLSLKGNGWYIFLSVLLILSWLIMGGMRFNLIF